MPKLLETLRASFEGIDQNELTGLVTLVRCSGFIVKGVQQGHVWLPYKNGEYLDKNGLPLEAALVAYPEAIQSDSDAICNQCLRDREEFLASQEALR